jgi:DNA-binding SARP family transcriptional activator/nucleoside-triphosphatase THEP1
MSTATTGLLVPPGSASWPDTPHRSDTSGRYARSFVSDGRGRAWRYRVLGGLVVEGDDGRVPDLGGRKQRAVLAALLLELDRAVPADRLIDQVWGGEAPPRAAASLQAYVSKLRRQLEPERPAGAGHEVLVTEPGGYRLAADRAAVDLARFDDLRLDAAAALAAGDAATAAERYDAALALDGPLLPELAGEPWVADAAARLEAAHADALDGAFEAKLALGLARELVGALEAAVAAHPFQERLRGHLALALYRAGRQTEALRSLAEARRVLAEQIGVEPGPELRQLEADILAQAPRLETPARRTASRTAGPAPVVPGGGTPPGGGPAGQMAMVGRSAERAWLAEAARQAATGAGRAVVVTGEPGIGKTRLAEELVAEALGEGFVVAWARCQESASSAPYWGYTQIAEQLLAAGVISDAARDGISAAGGGVHSIDPGADGPMLHATMVAALRSATRPMLLVVDDLQWADASSLRALEFVAGALATVPVLLVTTVRPVGADAPAALVDCLAELARQPGSEHIDLHGLTHADVGAWLSRRGGRPVGAEVADYVHERTGGNPFFVGEVVELLARQDRLTDVDAARGARVPGAALDVVRRRVGMLPAATQPLLATASVLGLTIELDVLAHVAGVTAAEALDALDPAVEVGLLAEDPAGPARLRFAHALVADALAAELSAGRRARLHAAVVAAIEDLRSANLDEHLAALVHHGRAGAVAGVAPQAFDHATRAARRAGERGAFEVAAGYWDDARSLLDLARPGDRQARYDVLVELGQARLDADDVLGAQAALLDAIDIAEAEGHDLAVRRAAAALATTTLWQISPYGEVDLPLVRALERTRAAAGDAPAAERAVLAGAHADALYYHPDPAAALALSSEAVELARAAGDPDTLVLALSQRFRALWRDTLVPEQEEVATEIVAVAASPGVHAGLVAVAHLIGAVVAFSHADRPTYERHMAEARTHADRSQMPGLISQVAWAEVAWLLARGRYDDALALARETDRLYRRTRGWQADDILEAFEVSIAHDRGTLVDPVAQASALIERRFDTAARELIGWMLTEDGRLDRARALVGPEGTVPDPPADWLWFETTTAAAHVRAALGDVAACAVLHERLRPFAGRADVTAGPFLGGIDLALARTSDVLGDAAGARRHAAAAVALLDRLGTPPALARALLVQAGLLAASDDAADRRAAAAVLDRARTEAESVALAPVVAAVDRMQAGSKVGGA